MVHSAIVSVANGSSVPYTGCTNQQYVKSTNNATTFLTFCSMDQRGNNGTKQHEETLQGCLDSCDAYKGCAAVTFDLQLSYGWQNCYIKTTNKTFTPAANLTFALALPSLSPGDTTYVTASSSASSKDSKPSAWIAGPVVGGLLAAVLLFSSGVFFWRRRNRHAKEVSIEMDEKQKLATRSPGPAVA